MADSQTADPETIYAAPAKWVASGAGAQGNLFLTGRAGTGKTTMLRKFLASAGDRAIVLAPTGVAAMNAGGQTIHSFFKFPPRLIEPADIKRLRSTRLIKAIDTLIIDEISMVRADMLDAMRSTFESASGSAALPLLVRVAAWHTPVLFSLACARAVGGSATLAAAPIWDDCATAHAADRDRRRAEAAASADG